MRFIALVGLAIALFAVASAIAGDVPHGSYEHSCQNISVKEDVLYADCIYLVGDYDDKFVNHTHLNHVSRCVGDIGNAYGRLTCSKWSNVTTQPTQQQSQQQLPDWSAVDQKQAYCKGRCACCASGNCGDTSICISKSASVDPNGYYGCFKTCTSHPIGSF